jgi:hypothetical protein
LKDGPAVISIMGGLGGRDISIDDCITMFERTRKSKRDASGDEVVSWIGLRE